MAFQDFQKAKIFGDGAHYDSSVFYYKKAAIGYEKVKYWKGQVLAFNGIGACYALSSRHKNADFYLREALDLGLFHLGEVSVIADTYQHLGFNWGKQGDYEKRQWHYEMALQIRLKTLSKDHPKVALSYNNLSASYLEKGAYDKALEFALLGLEIQMKTNPTDFPISQSYNNIAAAYSKKGQFGKAREYFQKALDIMGEGKGERGQYVAIGYSNLGSCYRSEGKYSEAINSYYIALEKIKRVVGESHVYTALFYLNLGNVYFLKEDFHAANDVYYKARDILSTLSLMTHPYYATTLINLGKCFGEMNDPVKSLYYLQEGIIIQKKALGTKHPDLASSYFLIGEYYKKLGKWERSQVYFQSALVALAPNFDNTDISTNPQPEQVSSKTILLNILRAKAEVLYNKFLEYSRIETLKLSNVTYQLAIETIEQQLIELGRETTKQEWIERSMSVFDGAIRTAYQLNKNTGSISYLHQAFSYSERSKAVILLQAIKDGNAKQFSDVPDSLVEEENRLKIDRSFYKNQWFMAKQKGDTAKIKQYRQTLFGYNARFDALREFMETKFANYYKLKYDRSITSLLETQEKLLDPKTALLEYFEGDSVLYIFVVAKNWLNLYTIKKTPEFHKLISSFHKALTNYKFYQDSTTVANTTYTKTAFRLYQLLLEEPLREIGTSVENIIIVPDGKLNYLSFGAFLEHLPARLNSFRYRDLPYVLRKYNISYGYSASFLATVQSLENKRSRPKLVFGGYAPKYNLPSQINTVDTKVTAKNSAQLNPLPGAIKEVKQLASMFKEKAWIGTSATERVFKETAYKYQILHLSMHGLLNDQEPLLSKLLFTPASDSLEDGGLSVSEIYNLKLQADLVVLSACNSGLGELKRGEGMISLSRAFAYAGCPSLTSSLWSVSDEITGSTMVAFYENLKHNLPKDQSLRKAQLQYLNQIDDPFYEHPYFWAGFICVGDVRPLVIIEAKLNLAKPLIILFFGVIALIFLVIRRKRKPDQLFNIFKSS